MDLFGDQCTFEGVFLAGAGIFLCRGPSYFLIPASYITRWFPVRNPLLHLVCVCTRTCAHARVHCPFYPSPIHFNEGKGRNESVFWHDPECLQGWDGHLGVRKGGNRSIVKICFWPAFIYFNAVNYKSQPTKAAWISSTAFLGDGFLWLHTSSGRDPYYHGGSPLQHLAGLLESSKLIELECVCVYIKIIIYQFALVLLLELYRINQI